MESLIKTPKTKRGEMTLQKILDSAEQLFYEKGYHATSISDITSGANVALGTFYIYFNDKYSLYKYLLLYFSHRIRKHIALAIKDSDSRLESEAIGFKAFLEFIREHKSAYRIIWESLYIDYDLFRDYYETFALRYVKGLLEAQIKQEVKDIDPYALAYMLMGMSNFIGLKWVIFDDKKNYDDVVEKIMFVLKEGLFIKKEDQDEVAQTSDVH